jgi:hypothetical protein
MKIARWFLPTLLALMGILTLAVPVLAQVEQPTALEIDEIEAFQNAKDSGDQLYIITYYVTQNSTYDIDQLYIFRLRDASGNHIDATTAYPYYNQGYGLGVVAFYLTASEAPTWGSAVSVEIAGNPFATWNGTTPSVSSSIITWNTGQTQEVQQMVSVKIMELASRLSLAWGVAMTTTTQGVTILSETGASYFLRVVPYLSEVAPYVLGSYTFLPDYPEHPSYLSEQRPGSTAYADELEQGILGTIFDLTGPARSMGMTRGTLTAILYYAFVVAFFILLVSQAGLTKGLMMLLWPFVIGGAFIGVPLAVTIVGAFVCLVSTTWVIYKGATS